MPFTSLVPWFENVRSPSVIDFPFGGSAEDAIKEWPTLSNAANIKIREIFIITFFLSNCRTVWFEKYSGRRGISFSP